MQPKANKSLTTLFPPHCEMMTDARSQHTFSVKRQNINTFGFESRTVSVAITQFHHYRDKGPQITGKLSDSGGALVKLYLWTLKTDCHIILMSQNSLFFFFNH